jgi:hypothetical protein
MRLIELTHAYDLVYKWFDSLKSKGHYITGYVIMPNHVHVMIGFGNTSNSINTVVGNGKRFIAYGIVERLQTTGQFDILTQLKNAVTTTNSSKGSLHKVFEQSFDIKECRSMAFVNQKLTYIHNNPLAKKWSLARDTISYAHSSARFYETGEQGTYPVTNFIDILDKDWGNQVDLP